MKTITRTIILCVALTALLSVGACTAAPTNAPNNNTSIATAPATPTASPALTPQPSPVSDTASARDLPITLPVLDAFFADESFASDLKTKLNLTDEQISKLRSAAREQTSSLRESDAGNYQGTTTEASARAADQIKAIIGPEKTDQLLALVRQRWSGTEEQTSSASSAVNNSAGNNNSSSNNNTSGSNPNSLDLNSSSGNGASGNFNAIPTDTRIVVNTPAYRMDIFDNGRLFKTYKVGIGYPEFPLPTGLRKASSIIFNPTWTPPDEPWVEASNKVKAGQKIEAGSKLNPLGPIKIPIGMPSLIHGGKSPAKLGSFASHGCVGLTTPQVEDVALKLAQLGGADLNDEKLRDFLKDKTQTKSVKLNQAVPVELRYETIVVVDGKLHIYRDVYDKGTNTEESLRGVLAAYGVTTDQLTEQERAQTLKALKQMSRDATGKPTGDFAGANSNVAPNNKNKKNESSRVTRAVKGQKEIVIPINALAGKGYPLPVDLDTGGAAQNTAGNSRSPSRKKR